MFFATVIGGVLCIFDWIQPQGWDWVLLGSLGVFGYFGQLYMTKAFQAAATNIIAPIKYTEVIFTIAIGVFWFDESYSFWSFVGLFLIISALIPDMRIPW